MAGRPSGTRAAVAAAARARDGAHSRYGGPGAQRPAAHRGAMSASHEPEMFFHRRQQRLARQQRALEPDQANTQAVDAVGRRDQRIASASIIRSCNPQSTVVASVSSASSIGPWRRAARCADARLRSPAGRRRKRWRRSAWPPRARACRAAGRRVDQPQVDMCNLQPTLRHRAQQSLGLQARDQLAHRPERHAQQLHQLALRDELPGPDVGLRDLLLEVLVGLRAQARRGGTRRRCRTGGRHAASTTPLRSSRLP